MKYLMVLLALTFMTILYGEDPWGEDADMNLIKASEKQTINNYMVDASSIIILFRQNIMSPADGPRSHFIPSSSQYTLEAVREYGFLRGWLLGMDRLLRENGEKWIYPHVYTNGMLMKHDPVKKL